MKNSFLKKCWLVFAVVILFTTAPSFAAVSPDVKATAIKFIMAMGGVVISTFVKEEAESVSSIFDSAVADEKEIYDLFGINFVGNKELKRLYMPEDWEGYPLRKDYVENDERLSWND